MEQNYDNKRITGKEKLAKYRKAILDTKSGLINSLRVKAFKPGWESKTPSWATNRHPLASS